MLQSIHSSLVRSTGFDSDYQAILNRAIALGYSLPSISQQRKQNTLVTSFKVSGIWSLLDVLYVFSTDASSDFATINWKNPLANQASKVNSPSFTVNVGFASNGTNSYLQSTCPNVNFTQNNASYGFYMAVGSADAGTNYGIGGFQDKSVIFKPVGQNVTGRVNHNAANPIFPDFTVQSNTLYAAKRTNSTQVVPVKNGVDATPAVSSSQAVTNSTFQMLNMFYLAAPAWRMSMAFTGSGSINQLALYNAWNTYFTSL